MSKVQSSPGVQESKIPILGKQTGGRSSLSRLASLSNRVRAHLSADNKLRPSSGMLLGLLGQSTKKNKRPTEFYQPLQEFCHKSEGCSPEEEKVSGIHIGRRVLVSETKVGTLRYFGGTSIGDGIWCGVELDADEGEHDGCVKGVRYFCCPSGRGIFAPESEVTLFLQVRYISEVSSSGPHSLLGLGSQGSTPGSPPLSSRHSSSAGSLVPKGMDVPSKHSSFELDESLGILTPDQMSDFTLNCPLERSPSAEELSSFMLQDIELSEMALETTDKRNSMEIKEDIDIKPTEVAPDVSLSESVLSKKTDLISASSTKSKKDSRVDRTPSLEDLPLDSTGDTNTEKTESYESKSRAPSSFITSITSITSLDNGYQGDGEWSRPASRGPEHSPSGKGRSVKSRLDPMTDSDFFTESDADMAEEWGHRRAQVIDGTLYGVQPGLGAQGHVQRFSPSNEEMDSSGIYSDLDKRPEDPAWIKEEEERPLSPEGSIRTVSSKSDQSLKKMSTNSFSTLIEQQVNTIKNLMAMDVQEQEDEVKMVDEAMEEKPEPKKTKAPKRNVVSKIKIMITTTNVRKDEDQENRVPRPVKKGRWDAVMNKIAQGQAEERTTPKLKEVKSKVFSGISGGVKPSTPPRPSTAGSRKASTVSRLSSAQSISTRSLRDIATLKTKSRRTRIRSSESSLQGTPCSQASSRNSSVSDLSQMKSCPTPPTRTGKKREATRCTSPQSDGSTTSVASQVAKKSTVTPPRTKTPTTGKNGNPAEKTPLVRKTTPRRGLNSSQSHKPQPLRDHNRSVSGGGGRVGDLNKVPPRSAPLQPLGPPQPALQTSAPPRPDLRPQLKQATKGAQALAVLVNHLVYNLDAFSTPQLRRDLERIKSKWLRSQLELEEMKASFDRLQEEYNLEKVEKDKELEDIEKYHKLEVDEMQNKYKNEMDKLTRNFEDSIIELKTKFELKEKSLTETLDKRLSEVETFHAAEKASLSERLSHLEELEDQLRRHERAAEAAQNRETQLMRQVEEMRCRYDCLKEGIQLSGGQQQQQVVGANGSCTPEYRGKPNRTLSVSSALEAEVESLQCVLELRCSELQELRRQSQVWRRDAEQLPAALQRIACLTSRVGDLQAEINRKEEIQKQLQQEKQILSDTIVKESTQKKRISLQNEELQWKLKQNSLVFNALAGISTPSTPKNSKTPVRGAKTPTAKRLSYELNKTASEADINVGRLPVGQVPGDKSPPGSPTVKSVIEKNDSVSWVLDMEEPPEFVASRILRRALKVRAGTLSESKSSPTSPELRASPLKVSWEPQVDADNVTEEVIMVKGIAGSNVLELLSVDESDIFIEDLPRRGGDGGSGTGGDRLSKTEEELEMLRRLGERQESVVLPKDSAGEAMISGEASDEEAEEEVEDDDEEEDEDDGEEEDETSSSGDLSEGFLDGGGNTRLYRPNGTSEPVSLSTMELSWSEETSEILHSEG